MLSPGNRQSIFPPFSNLQVIFTLGAGVDKIPCSATIFRNMLTIIRLTDAGMAQQMTEYALYGLLHYQRKMDIYRSQQQNAIWQPLCQPVYQRHACYDFGLGHLGVHVAQTLAGAGLCSQWLESAAKKH